MARDSEQSPDPIEAPTAQDDPLASAIHVGEALRLLRERRGLSLDQVAAITKIPAKKLTALETNHTPDLPERPFVIGFIRAYAAAIGVSPAAAVARYDRDLPDLDAPLPEPKGVGRDKDARLSFILGGGMIVAASIVAWNVAQYAMRSNAPPPPEVPDAVAPPFAGPPGRISLGQPTEPPVESTRPKIYQTPGLPMEPAGSDAVAETPAAPKPTDLPLDAAPTFQTKGAVYGTAGSRVVVQARRSAVLVVNGTGEVVLFAQQLKQGEAYAAPPGTVIDADPDAFNVYVDGALRPRLPGPKTAVSSLAR